MLATTIAFLTGFLVLTIYAAVDRGFTILSVVSLLVLLLMAVGILGAIWQGPDDE
jgi:uncharacterized membrane protein YdcZ (DUF606 family)